MKSYLLITILFPLFLGAQKYEDVSHLLPDNETSMASMDVRAMDADGDGDLDIVLANEFQPNVLLINQGVAGFKAQNGAFEKSGRDSEDIAIADFDGDGFLDVVFCSEDDITLGRTKVHEYYLGNGDGTFRKAPFQLPDSKANAVVEAFINEDEWPDLVFGNDGFNTILINNGDGTFRDESQSRWSSVSRTTQDIQIADVNGDGHDDIFEGNEDGNVLWVNDGTGKFADITTSHLPPHPEVETRKAAFGDLDGDGDLDVFLSNVRFRPGKNAANLIWINDGLGKFTPASVSHIQENNDDSLDGLIIDVDEDGHADIVVANVNLQSRANQQIFQNIGSAVFHDRSDIWLPRTYFGNILGVISDDFNGDGRDDLYWCDRGGKDVLMFKTASGSTGFQDDEPAIRMPLRHCGGLAHISAFPSARLNLFDLTGQLVETSLCGDQQCTLNRNLKNGLYVLQAYNSERSSVGLLKLGCY